MVSVFWRYGPCAKYMERCSFPPLAFFFLNAHVLGFILFYISLSMHLMLLLLALGLHSSHGKPVCVPLYLKTPRPLITKVVIWDHFCCHLYPKSSSALPAKNLQYWHCRHNNIFRTLHQSLSGCDVYFIWWCNMLSNTKLWRAYFSSKESTLSATAADKTFL